MSIKESKDKLEILVVDDEEKNLQVLAGHLHRSGYDVVFASHGKEALNALEPVLPDLVLLDVMMPEMDGYEVCEKMRERFRGEQLPIIFLTARTADEDIIKGFEAGAQDYIVKPLKIPELLARVKTQLDLKRARENLASSNESLSKLNQQQKRMFSILSHDLRSSISAVSNLLEELGFALAGTFDREEFTGLVGQANQSMTNLTDLMRDVLTWSRSQMDVIQYKPQEFIMSECVKGLFAHFEKQIKQKQLKLVNEMDPGTIVNADLDIVSTILRNLISNSIKYTAQGGTITINVELVDEQVSLVVKDTGIGMSEELIAKILDQSEFSSTLGTENERGTGLGLSLCLGLIRHHGGQMEISSSEKKGTTVTFRLPTVHKAAVSSV